MSKNLHVAEKQDHNVTFQMFFLSFILIMSMSSSLQIHKTSIAPLTIFCICFKHLLKINSRIIDTVENEHFKFDILRFMIFETNHILSATNLCMP